MITIVVIGSMIATIYIIASISLRKSNKERNIYLSLLRSSDQDNRINGTKSLLRIKALEKVDDLFNAFNKEKSSKVRKAIIEALYEMNLLYRNYDKGRRDTGAALTLDLPRQETVLQKYILPPFREALHSENREEREAAIMALIWIGTKEAFEALKESSIEFVSPDIVTQNQQDIQFTVFYPVLCKKTESNSIYVYAYIHEMLKHVYKDILINTDDFGRNIPNMVTLKQTIKLLNNAIITIIPECDKVDFTPQSMTNLWNCEMVRYNFSFKIKDGLILNDDELDTRISVRIYSIEIAHIQLKLRLIDKSPINERQNPLAIAKYSCNNFIPYQKIFVSYSRKDNSVVSVYKAA